MAESMKGLKRTARCAEITEEYIGQKVTLKDFAITRVAYEGESRKMYGFYFGYDLATPGVKLQNAWYTTMGSMVSEWRAMPSTRYSFPLKWR